MFSPKLVYCIKFELLLAKFQITSHCEAVYSIKFAAFTCQIENYFTLWNCLLHQIWTFTCQIQNYFTLWSEVHCYGKYVGIGVNFAMCSFVFTAILCQNKAWCIIMTEREKWI